MDDTTSRTLSPWPSSNFHREAMSWSSAEMVMPQRREISLAVRRTFQMRISSMAPINTDVGGESLPSVERPNWPSVSVPPGRNGLPDTTNVNDSGCGSASVPMSGIALK